MFGSDGSELDIKKWTRKRIPDDDQDINELINKATIDELLCVFHSAAKSGTLKPNKQGFMETPL